MKLLLDDKFQNTEFTCVYDAVGNRGKCCFLVATAGIYSFKVVHLPDAYPKDRLLSTLSETRIRKCYRICNMLFSANWCRWFIAIAIQIHFSYVMLRLNNDLLLFQSISTQVIWCSYFHDWSSQYSQRQWENLASLLQAMKELLLRRLCAVC